MARYGVNVLLTKYNNPINLSPRILINKKSYYHPYEMGYESGYQEYVLYNGTKIGDVKLDLTRGSFYLMFCYQVENYTITFSRRVNDSVYISILIKNPTKTQSTWAERYSPGGKFVISGDSKFLTLTGIAETTLAEIYKNHLPFILDVIQI